ncbi:hypothetical protein HMPREF3198_00334 [Winkia neuii]|uniref:variant leucine-rich repeat-containing protein n=1 Tax=Winkia neuii TaxID=33007 RepID=UPI000763C03E|nr:hypothetical protein [Winkia neuii]KWZ75036.1 hypothetical protein HMPREF3198_00334 [Winkia neuii]
MSLEETQQDLSDPQLAPIRLQQIAGEFPQLRPQIALHPQAYPALLEWLQNLGDPQVQKALSRRRAFERLGGQAGGAAAAATENVPPEGPDPDESTLEQEPENMPATPAEDEAEGQGKAEEPAFEKPEPQPEVTYTQVEVPRQKDEQVSGAGSSPANVETTSVVAGAGKQDAAAPTVSPQKEHASNGPETISYTSAYGGQQQNPEETVVIPKFEQDRLKREYQNMPAPSAAASAAKKPKKSKAVPILATLLAIALIVLVASGILLFKNWSHRSEPAAKQTQTQSQAPSQSAEPASPEPTESESPEWTDPNKAPFPISGQYVQAGAFVMPSGNIACKLEGDTASCTVYENDYRNAGFENCGEGKTTMVVSGDAAAALRCGVDAQTESTRPLQYGQTAFKDKVACSATQDGVKCWNLDSGKSFFANRQGWSRGSNGQNQ